MKYKIIIPKEEQIKCYCGHTTTCDCGPLEVSDEAKQRAVNYMRLKDGYVEPKQETLEELEEAACKALGYDYNDWVSLFSKDKSTVIYSEVTNWCKGAKWQAERMYSEAIEFGEWIKNNPYVWNYSDKLNDTRTTEELFKQFKKK